MSFGIHIADLKRITDVRLGSAPIAPRLKGKEAELSLTQGRRVLRWKVDGRTFRVVVEGDLSEETVRLTCRDPWISVDHGAAIAWLEPVIPSQRPRRTSSRLDTLSLALDPQFESQMRALYGCGLYGVERLPMF
jgi:hypothetical protein